MAEYVWAPHPLHVWVPAQLVSSDGGVSQFRTQSGESIALSDDRAAQLERVSEQSLRADLDNLVNLDEFGEGAVIHQLRSRYSRGEIYTNIGSILVSINPYAQLPIYGAGRVEQYRAAAEAGPQALAALDPHVFAVAAEAYARLYDEDLVGAAADPSVKRSQAIICSGESGAGKTEVCKSVLQYLSDVAGSVSGVEQQILKSNPILESFGNSRTLRNNNSSRFGKWMEISFEPVGTRSAGGGAGRKILAARIQNFLLEQSRVTACSDGERSYHVFYQLCAGLDPAARAELGILPAGEYRYLSQSGCTTVPGVDDAEEFGHTAEAMRALQFPEEVISSIWRLLAGILAIGNLAPTPHPEKGDLTVIGNRPQLELAARTLGLPSPDVLASALCYRSVTIRGSLSMIPLGLAEVQANRDALAKTLYARLFDHMVERMNRVLFRNGTDLATADEATRRNARSIGILDIFGFEIFDNNLFEQLCINYCNERLQAHFNQLILRIEQEEYRSEGIDVREVKFVDNIECVALIDARGTGSASGSAGSSSTGSGILALMDEELLIPRGSDATLLAKMHATFASKGREHPHYDLVRKRPECFVVKHYAGDVTYNSQGLLYKNKNRLNENLEQLMQGGSSSLQIIADIFAQPATAAAATAGAEEASPASPTATSSVGMKHRRGVLGGASASSSSLNSPSNASKKKESTLSFQFQCQLSELMRTLQERHGSFVRCLKPNAAKQSALFQSIMVREQMSAAGLFEAIRIRKSGYPFRSGVETFAKRYRPCLDAGDLVQFAGLLARSPRDAAAFLLDRLQLEPGSFQLGKTKVFLKSSARNRLDALRDGHLLSWAVRLQRWARVVLARKLLVRLRSMDKRCRAVLSGEAACTPESLAALEADAEGQGLTRHLFVLTQVAAAREALAEVGRVSALLQEAIAARTELLPLQGALAQAERLAPAHPFVPAQVASLAASRVAALRDLGGLVDSAAKRRDHLLEEQRLTLALQQAIRAESLAQLDAALAAAVSFGLDGASALMQQGAALLAQLREEEAMMAALRAATNARDKADLEHRITAVQHSGVSLDAPRKRDYAAACTALRECFADSVREAQTARDEKQLRATLLPALQRLEYHDLATEVQSWLVDAEAARQRASEAAAREREAARAAEEQRLARERQGLAAAEQARLAEQDRARRAEEDCLREAAEASERAERLRVESVAHPPPPAPPSSRESFAGDSGGPPLPPPPPPHMDDEEEDELPPPVPDDPDSMPPPPMPAGDDAPPLPPPPPSDHSDLPPPPEMPPPPASGRDASLSFAGPATLAEHPLDVELDAAVLQRSLPALERALASAAALKHHSRLVRIADNMRSNLLAESRLHGELAQAVQRVDVERCKALLKECAALGLAPGQGQGAFQSLVDEARSMCYGLSEQELTLLRIRKALPLGDAPELRRLLLLAAEMKLPANEWLEQAKDFLASKLFASTGANPAGASPAAGIDAASLAAFAELDWNTTMRYNRNKAVPAPSYAAFHASRGLTPLHESNFPPLRREGNYAKGNYLTKGALKEKRLAHQIDSLPRSLVKLNTEYCGGSKDRSKAIKLLAKQIFKNIRGYQRDVYHSYPSTLAYDVVMTGLAQPLLRDEILCLLIKQTTSNPGGDSQLLGLKLMYLCLSSFRPSAALKPVLWSHLSQFAHSTLPEGTALGFQLAPDIASHCYITMEHLELMERHGVPVKPPTMVDIEALTNGSLAKRSGKFTETIANAKAASLAAVPAIPQQLDEDLPAPPPQ